jgi:hypothetical protein
MLVHATSNHFRSVPIGHRILSSISWDTASSSYRDRTPAALQVAGGDGEGRGRLKISREDVENAPAGSDLAVTAHEQRMPRRQS